MNQALKRTHIAHMPGQNVDINPLGKEAVNEELVSLIAGKRGKKLLAPILFKGSTNALWFNEWLEKHLLPELKPNSTLILDNATISP